MRLMRDFYYYFNIFFFFFEAQRKCTMTMDKGIFFDLDIDEPEAGEPMITEETTQGNEEKLEGEFLND